MNQKVKNKIKLLKSEYESLGFIIIGIFGSYARGEETNTSDLDILYEISDELYKKYPGWNIVPVINNIKKEIETKLGKKIDLVDKYSLKDIGKKYILPEVHHV